jgi:hypothetical protein
VRLYDTQYWAPELGEHAGAKVIVRFDPDDLQREVHVYDLAGRFLATAPVWGAVAYTDRAAARDRARLEADYRRASRAALAAEQLLSAAELAALLPDDVDEAELHSPTVIRPVRLSGGTAAALKPAPEAGQPPKRGCGWSNEIGRGGLQPAAPAIPGRSGPQLKQRNG